MKKEGYSIRSPMHRSDTDTDTDADTDTDTDTVSALRCCHDINRCDQIRSDQIRSDRIRSLIYFIIGFLALFNVRTSFFYLFKLSFLLPLSHLIFMHFSFQILIFFPLFCLALIETDNDG